MVVKVKFLKDHGGYKAGQEWAMLSQYAERFQDQGILTIEGNDISAWVVTPEPEEEEDVVEEDDQPPTEEELNFLSRFLNNKK